MVGGSIYIYIYMVSVSVNVKIKKNFYILYT